MLLRQLKLLLVCLAATVAVANPTSAQILLGLQGAYSGTGTDITGLVLGNGTTLSAYGGGGPCVNQFPRSMNASGVWSCASITATDLGTTLIPQFDGLGIGAAGATGQIRAPSGTSAVPGLAFSRSGNWDNGFVDDGANGIQWTLFGAARGRLTTGGLIIGGAGGAHVYFTNSLGVGADAQLMRISANTIGVTMGGAALDTTTSWAPLIGVASAQTSAAGVGNGADATDDTLFTYSLPINALSANGKSVRVRAAGVTAANTNLKNIKLWFAGTAGVTTGALAFNGANWSAEMEVTRIDATHVSVVASILVSGALLTNDVLVTPNLVVADLSANATVIKVTGASSASAANDILGHQMKVWFEN